MDITEEILAYELREKLLETVKLCQAYSGDVIQTTAVQCLQAIQAAIKDESKSDFDVVEEIDCIFENYGIDAGIRHDFG